MVKAATSNPILARVVRAVVKAVNEDVPEYLREQGKETNNCVIHMRGDCINDNLRNFVVGDMIDLLSFQRYSWQGRLLVDRANKSSYTITTRNNLLTIPKKQRTSPHFLHSILFKLNGNMEAAVKQIAFFDVSPFEDETLEEDFKSIVGELLDPAEGYHHYVIVYETIGTDVTSISMELLDKDFDVIESRSLNEFIQPDILHLTDPTPDISAIGGQDKGSAKQLVRIKESARLQTSELPEVGVSAESVDNDKGFRPKLHIMDEEA